VHFAAWNSVQNTDERTDGLNKKAVEWITHSGETINEVRSVINRLLTTQSRRHSVVILLRPAIQSSLLCRHRRRIRGGRSRPPPKKKSGKYFSATYVKFGHFSGRCHVKFGHFVIFLLLASDVFTVRRYELHGLIVIVILSVRLSVCLSHSCTVSSWFNLRSWFLHHMVATSF